MPATTSGSRTNIEGIAGVTGAKVIWGWTGAVGRGAAIVVLAGTLAPAPVAAHDHAPPRTAAVSPGGRMLAGQLGSFCWSTGAVFVTGECARHTATFPRLGNRDFAARTLRIRKSLPPDEVVVFRWTKVGHAREPAGRRESVAIKGMRPVLTASGVTWDYALDLPVRKASYLLVYGEWRDSEGCATCPAQQARWLFSIPGRGEGG